MSALSGQDPGELPESLSSAMQKRSEKTEQRAVKRANAQGVGTFARSGSIRVHARGTFARRRAHRDEMKKRVAQLNSDVMKKAELNNIGARQAMSSDQPSSHARMVRRMSIEVHRMVRHDSVDRRTEEADVAERV